MRKIISLILCVSMLMTMMVTSVTTVAASDTQKTELLLNGGFEEADDYGFPLGWDSDGKNIIPNSDWESNSLSAGYALDGTTAVKWGRAGGGDSTVTVVSNGSDKPEGIGNYSLKTTWNAVKWGGAAVRNDNGLIPFAYGSDYIARATVKAGDNSHFPAAANRFQFCFLENVVNKSTNKNEFYVDDNSWIPTTNWQEFSKQFTTWKKDDVTENANVATLGTHHTRYQLRTKTSAVANAELFVDKFSIEKISRTSDASVSSGNKSLMIKGYADGLTDKWASDYVNVASGQTIAVSAKVNVANIAQYTFASKTFSPKVAVVAEFNNGTNTEIASYTTATNGFVAINQYVEVPTGASSVRLAFTVDGEGIAYFDDASMIGSEVAQSNLEQVLSFSNDFTAVQTNNFSDMSLTTVGGESCTKFQGNTTAQEQMWFGYGGALLGSSDFVMSYDVYPTESVKSYRIVTSGHTQLATDITDTMFVKNQWNNITLVVNGSSTTNTLYVNGTKIGDYKFALKSDTVRIITWAKSKEAQTSTVTYYKNFYIYKGKINMPLIATTLSISGKNIFADKNATYSDVLDAITISSSDYTKEILYNGESVNLSDTIKSGAKLVIKDKNLFLGDYTLMSTETLIAVKEYHDDLTVIPTIHYGDMSTQYYEGENCSKWVGKESYASNGNPETQMWWDGSFTGAGNENLVLSVSFYPTDTLDAVNFATTSHASFHTKVTAEHWEKDAWNTMTVVVDAEKNQNHLYLNNQFISTTNYDVKDTIRFVAWAKDGKLPGATIYVDDFCVIKGSYKMPLINTTLTLTGKNIDASGKTYAEVKQAITLNNDAQSMKITYNGADVQNSDTVKNGAKLTITQAGVYVGELTLSNATLSTFHVHRDGYDTSFGGTSHCEVTNATLNGEPCFLMTGIETTDTGNQMFVSSTSTAHYQDQDLVISVSVYVTTQIKHIMFATGGHATFVPIIPLSSLELNKWNEITITMEGATNTNNVYVNGELFGTRTQALKSGAIRICVYGSSETGKIEGTTAYLDNLVISKGTAKIPAAKTTLPLNGMYINGFGGMSYAQVANTFKGTNKNTTYKFFKNGVEITDTSVKAEKDVHMAVYTNGVFISEYILGIDNYTMGDFVKSAERFGKGEFNAGYKVECYGSSLNSMAVLAQYKGNQMINCNVSYDTLSGSDIADVTLYDIEKLDGTYLKYFLFEQGSLKPISNPVTILPYSEYAIEKVVNMYPGFTMKAATFSYDDGVAEDIKTIESLNKYGAKATFNVVAKFADGSNRLLGYYKNKGTTEEEIVDYIIDLYDGHEIANHTYSHPPVQLEVGQTSTDSYGNTLNGVDANTVITQVADNHTYMKDLLGVEMSGIAWSYSGPYKRSDYKTIHDAILDSGYLYARNHGDSYSYELPTDWFKWNTTCSISKMPQVTDDFVALDAGDKMKLLYIWGHSYEYGNPERYGSGDWTTLEENLAKLADADVWFATNREVYDYVNALDKVTYNVNSVTNGSGITVYLKVNGKNIELGGGETFYLNESQQNIPSIACWGDSLTMGQGASDRTLYSYPARLASLTGATVYNMGIGGETPVTIASRQGVLDIEFTEGFTIPNSSNDEVEIKFAASNGGVVTPRNASIGGWAPCTINGVDGTMRIVLNSSTWPRTLTAAYFKRNDSGEAVTVNVGDKLIPNAHSVKGDINIIYSGANAGWTKANTSIPSDYSKDIPEFLDLLKTQGEDSNNGQYIIIGMTTDNDAKWELLDSEMEERFGDNFLNLRKFISSTEAFELMGMTPTDADLAAIEAGSTPPSFLATGDTTHYNDYGYKLAAIAIYNKLTELGYIGM